MKRVLTQHIIVIVLFVFVYIGTTVQLGYANASPSINELKEFHELIKDGKPAYTTDQANAIVKELIPLIENIAGRKFKKIPEIRLIGSDEARKIIRHNLIIQMKSLKNIDFDIGKKADVHPDLLMLWVYMESKIKSYICYLRELPRHLK